ncbi:MAG: thiol oxidoreductase, partial [Bacteroidota bacterium]
MKLIVGRLWIGLIILFLMSCSEDDEGEVSILEANEEFSAGEATVFDESENAFGQLAPVLSPAYNRQFVVGNSF